MVASSLHYKKRIKTKNKKIVYLHVNKQIPKKKIFQEQVKLLQLLRVSYRFYGKYHSVESWHVHLLIVQLTLL
jgi:hypothetical protein